MNAKPTKGPWKYLRAEWTQRKRGLIIVDNETGGCVAKLEEPMPWSSARKDYDANAALIVSAVNACFSVNPDNPLAAAEALPELVKACRKAQVHLSELSGNGVAHVQIGPAIGILGAALAKLGAK